MIDEPRRSAEQIQADSLERLNRQNVGRMEFVPQPSLVGAHIDGKTPSDADALKKWREWALFVFVKGRLVTGSDDELREIICARVNKTEAENIELRQRNR